MHPMQLSSVDLNSLVVLDALLQTESVRDAARRVGLSPSATSHALSRLRELFGDALFVRAGRRLVPTARAERLKVDLRQLLEATEGLLQGHSEFSARRLARSFTLSVTDYLELLLLPEA